MKSVRYERNNGPKIKLLTSLGWFVILFAFSPVAVQSEVPASLGDPVTPSTWETITQENLGKFTLFTFWEVTCEPCIEEMPGLIEVYKRLKPEGLEIVAVNTDPEARFEAAGKLVDKLELPFRLLYKAPGSDVKFRRAIDPEYGANPFAMLYDGEGNKIKTFPEAHTEEEWLSSLSPYFDTAKTHEALPAESVEPGFDPTDLQSLGQNLLTDPSIPDLGGGNLIDLSNLSTDQNLSSTQPVAKRNPFTANPPIWVSGKGPRGTLKIPFTSERPGHLLMSTVVYEKLDGKGISLGDWSVSKLDHYYMEVIDTTEEVLYTPGDVLIPVEYLGETDRLPIEFQLRFTFQGCTDGEGGLCYPPDTYILSGDISTNSQGQIEITNLVTNHHDPFAPLPTPNPAVAKEQPEDRVESTVSSSEIQPAGLSGDEENVSGTLDGTLIERTLKRSLFLLFALAFLGGILTSLTPCVYPMIPATVAIFGARDVTSTFQSVSLACTYILGVALSYAGLGVLAAAIGMVFGDFMENPWVIGTVALFYVVLALSMLDVFTFYLPSSWVTSATKVNGKGYIPAFLMGLVSSVVFAPCGEPILLGLLTWVAKTRDFFLGFWLLFVYAWGIGVLFLIIAVFSSSLRYLPKAGNWMVAVKDFFGLLLLGLAIYWLRFVLPEVWTLGLVTVYLLGCATFIHTKNHETKGWSRSILSFATLALILFASLPLQRWAVLEGWVPAGSSVQQVSVGSNPSGVPQHKERWITETPLTDLKSAHATGKPAIVDFRTNVCPKCDHIEENVFADGEVQKALEGFATIQVNLSDIEDNEEIRELRKEHDVFAVPVIVFYNSEGQWLHEKTVADEITAEEFLQLIRDIG